MYKLTTPKQAEILSLLVRGLSMRETANHTGASRNAVSRLLIAAGDASRTFHNERVQGITPARIECDEIWEFIHCKRKTVPTAKAPPPEAGDIWLFTAIDPDTKLLIAWHLCPNRGLEHTALFMEDIRARIPKPHKPQISTDGLHTFELGARLAFGNDMHFAQIIKPQKSRPNPSPEDDLFLKPLGDTQEKRPILGNPDMDKATTAHLESFNGTIRGALRRYTRRTRAFSKAQEHHAHNFALYATYYNWIRPHLSLGPITTPAMAAGLANRPFTFEGLTKYTDSLAPPPKPRGPYKPREKDPERTKSQLEKLQERHAAKTL